MKAIIYTEYGSPDVLIIQDAVKPTPKENEILVKVHAVSVNYGDTLARNFKAISSKEFNMLFLLWIMAKLSFGINKPKVTILGSEFAGVIEAVGNSVKQFKPGDRVFGYLGMGMGAYAEYLCMPETGTVALKPANMTYEEAASASYGGIMALPLLRKANVQSEQKILINGASGGIGSAAVQLAKYFGAEVTGVCSTPGVEYVKSLGADKVIDYTREDFTQNGETYDLIFDILGRCSFSKSKNSLKPNGIHLFASFKMKQLLQMLWTSKSRKRVICALAAESADNLNMIKNLIEAGKYKSIVDKCFPMEQAAEAHRYAESGQKKGNVVITITHDDMN